MNKKLIIFCLALAIAAMSVPAYADFTVTAFTSLVAWPEVPVIKCTANPGTDTTPANGQPYSGETNWGPGQQLGQVFMVPSTYVGSTVLDKLAVKLSGPACTLSVKLYDLWVGDNNDGYHGWANGNQGTLSPVDLAVKGTLLINGSYAYPGSATAKVYMFDFTGTQEVTLAYAEKYMFVLDRNTVAEPNAANMTWYRNGLYSYNNGDVYRDNGANGTTMAFVNGAGREAGMAVYIPEPATVALLCLGGLALLRRKRA